MHAQEVPEAVVTHLKLEFGTDLRVAPLERAVPATRT
jgi:hypothetical protein